MIHSFRISLFMPLALCVLSLLPLSVRAQTQGFDFVPGATRFDFTIAGAPSWTVGYQFKTAGDVTVYNLGFYDSGIAPLTYPGNGTATQPDGFTASHAVGLFDYTHQVICCYRRSCRKIPRCWTATSGTPKT